MKLCVVANSAWNLANFRLGFLKALIQRGWEVHVLVPDGPETRLMREAGCQVHDVFMDCKGTHPWHDGLLLLRLRRWYQRLQPDAVVHYTIKPVIYGSLAARMLGIPVLNAITGLGTAFLRDGWLQRLVRQLYKLALPASPSVMFENPDDLALFVKAGLLRPEQAVQVPGPGVDITHFAPCPLPDTGGMLQSSCWWHACCVIRAWLNMFRLHSYCARIIRMPALSCWVFWALKMSRRFIRRRWMNGWQREAWSTGGPPATCAR